MNKELGPLSAWHWARPKIMVGARDDKTDSIQYTSPAASVP